MGDLYAIEEVFLYEGHLQLDVFEHSKFENLKICKPARVEDWNTSRNPDNRINGLLSLYHKLMERYESEKYT